MLPGACGKPTSSFDFAQDEAQLGQLSVRYPYDAMIAQSGLVGDPRQFPTRRHQARNILIA